MNLANKPNNRSTAACLPNVQGHKCDTLWDSGAEITLIQEDLVDRLVESGAVRYKLYDPINIRGIGNGCMQATEGLDADVIFNDGKPRRIHMVIVPYSPYGIIMGYDFMSKEKIGFLSDGCGIELFDGRARNRPTIYSSHQDSAQAGTPRVNIAERGPPGKPIKQRRAYMGSKRIGSRSKKSIRKFINRWEHTSEEDKDLILTLRSLKLSDLSEEKLRQNIKNTSVNVVSSKEEELKVPQCDCPEYQERLENLICEFKDVFSTSASDVGKSSGSRVTIQLSSDTVVNVRNYRTPFKLRSVLKTLVDELLSAGIIEKCESGEFNSPVLLVPKKSDGSIGAKTHRLVIDYRALNKVIQTVVYPMPRIKDILDEYNESEYYNYVDIKHAFFTIQLDKNSRKFTAFSCELGKFQFRFLPQGLKIAPAVFQSQISRHIEGIKNTRAYMDDIMNGASTPEEAFQLLIELLNRLRKHGYKLSLPKCRFLVKEAVFAGFSVSKEGIAVTQDKITAAARLQRPRTISEVKSVLGFFSFLRDYVPRYCDLVGPIQDLLSIKLEKGVTDITPHWKEAQEKSFEATKRCLQSPQVMAFPDNTKQYILYTDASKKAMSAVLMQESDSKLKPIAYWSKAFRGSQRSWAPLVMEARAVKEAVEHFSVYLTGCRVLLRCDHKPLARFLEAKTKNDMVNRWSLAIQEYDLHFEWVSSENNLSDCLSRLGLDDLSLQLTKSDDDDFPAFPKSAAGKHSTTQTNVQIGNVSSTEDSRSTDRQHADADELKLFGILEEMTVKEVTHLTDEQVKYLQDHDNYCKRILANLDTSTEANGVFQIVNGLLYKHVVCDVPGKERLPGLALVIPKCLQLSVVLSLHKELNHAGRDKMLAAMKTKVHWKQMSRHTADFVRGCRICQHRNLKANEYKQIRIKPPSAPGIRLAIDTWSGGGGIALTAMDLHSCYPFAEEIPNKEALTICDAMQNILAGIRNPLEIISDNGTEFRNDHFKKLMKSRGIQHTFVAPYSPQSNGILERFHGYLNSIIRTTINLSRRGRWWPSVRSALESYRKLPHTNSMEAPLMLFMGQEPSYRIDKLLPILSREIWHTDENLLDLSQLHAAYALGRKNLCLQRLKSGRKPKMLDDFPLKKGDRVFRKNVGARKCDLKWLPGYRILKFESSRTAVIEHTETKTCSRVNVRQLRWADPVSELIFNSNIDSFPGTSKLYLSAGDLDDLNWEAVQDLPALEPDLETKAKEITRDRSNDLYLQEPPNKRARVDPDSAPSAAQQSTRPQRTRKRNIRLKDYHVGFTCVTNLACRSHVIFCSDINNMN